MKRSIKKFIALFMAICICCTSVEMKSFAVEGEIKNQVDNKVIDEINNEAVSSSIYKGQNISVDFIFYEKWDNGYTANFKIINNGEDSIDNWYLQFKFNDEIKKYMEW